MPKRMKDKNRSVFVKFHEDVSSKEIHSMLAMLGVSGTKVSSIINRWAVEVPFWKEEQFVAKFYDDDKVELVHESFDKRRTSYQEDPSDAE
jgi:hypothetical protein